jgi:SAM-dependent methyltransferase
MSALDQVADRRTVDDLGITLPASVGGVVTVAFDGRYVWSFRPRRDARATAQGLLVPWPVSLRPHLSGRTRLTLAEPGRGRTYVDQEVVFGGRPGHRLRIEDVHGHPLAVNKVGNLTRVFAETDDAAREEILRGTARVLEDLREHGGVVAFLNYGCLLGAVREGRMIGTDCDADVCYLSEKTHPADVIRESYALERAMLARGWPTVRMSGGDFKVLLRLTDGRTCYVDVFVAFYCEGVFYQLGNRSGYLPREAVTPTSTIVLEGVELPAPADPETMLAFVYGPSWRVPDPSFRFTDPPGGVRRLDGWLRGYRDDLPAWNELFRGPRAADVPKRRSDFARWVRRRVRPGDTVVEIGSGTGRDAAFFARRGHPVVAYDVSPEARTRTQRRLTRADPTSVVRRLALGELRTVVVTGAEVATIPGRHHVYARHVVNCLDDEGRRNLWRLARMALLGTEGRLFLEFATTAADPTAGTAPEGLAHRVDADGVVAEIEAYGGRVDRRVDGPGTGLFDQPDPSTCRLQVTFRRTGASTDV